MQNCSAGKLTRAGRVVFYTPCFRARNLAQQGEAQGGRGGQSTRSALSPTYEKAGPSFSIFQSHGVAGDNRHAVLCPRHMKKQALRFPYSNHTGSRGTIDT